MRQYLPQYRFIYAVRLISCIALGVTVLLSKHIAAQTQTTCVPLLPDRHRWPPGTEVSVRVDDLWDEAERQEFGTGAEKWNRWKEHNCSQVQFNFTGARHFTSEEEYFEDPPNNTVWFQRRTLPTGHEGVDANFGGNPERIISANIWIHPGRPNQARHYVYLGTHELGHTLGVQLQLPNWSIDNGSSLSH